MNTFPGFTTATLLRDAGKNKICRYAGLTPLLNVRQWKYYPQYQPTNGFGPITRDAVNLPIYSVEWSGNFIRKRRIHHKGTVLQVTISGVTKEMLEYHVYSESLFTNIPLQPTNLERILAISDDEFQHYNELQRSNLVVQYSTYHPTVANSPTPTTVVPK